MGEWFVLLVYEAPLSFVLTVFVPVELCVLTLLIFVFIITDYLLIDINCAY